MIINPKNYSQDELDRVMRAFVQSMYSNIGPLTDIPAPDVNTNPHLMGVFIDEYSKLSGQYTPGAVTGKSIGIGGSLGRNAATAQ